jgi:hypothetical protein
VFAEQDRIVVILDMANAKSYRIEATQNALFCLHSTFIELTHDYFYFIDEKTADTEHKCSIDFVSEAPLTDAGVRHVSVTGNSIGSHRTITAHINAEIMLRYQNISLLSATTTF